MTGTRSRDLPDGDAHAVLQRRARHLAEQKVVESQAGDLVVHLEVGGRRYALPSRRVREVLSPGPVTALPGRDRRLRGARSATGGVVAVADLTALSTTAGVADPSACFVVVVDGPAPLGLLAEQVTMAESTEQVPASPRTGSITGGVTPDGVTLIDVDALLADARFSVPVRAADNRPSTQGTP